MTTRTAPRLAIRPRSGLLTGPLPGLFAGPLPGLALSFAIGGIALAGANALPPGATVLSPLTLAMLLGLVVGNLLPALVQGTTRGIQISRGPLLRLGIVLFGLNLTFASFAAVGLPGALMAAGMMAGTFALAALLGPRLFGQDRETAFLIGIGSAICGAAAIVAAEPIMRSDARQTSIAILCVVLFGTASTVLYPLLYPHLGLSEAAFGLYAGATIHEVAQVVATASAIGEQAANTAVVEKMMRVLMLAPALLALSWHAGKARDGADSDGAARRITIPWFALGFVAVSLLNTFELVPPAAKALLLRLDVLMLASAMAALGLQTRLQALREAGLRPLLLGGTLTLFLAVAGYGAARLVSAVA